MSRLPFALQHLGLFAAAAACGLLAAAFAWRRRAAVSPVTASLAATALLLLALAAGGLTWHRPTTAEVAVMVDLSASTRGAAYRDRAALERRVRQLLGDVPYRLTYFAEQNTAVPPDGNPLPDLPGDATRFAPPAAPAVLLFSDARFDPPASAPPTFVVADRNLDQPADASVTRLEPRGREVAATVNNGGDRPRTLTLGRPTTRPAIPVEPGAATIARPLTAGATGTIDARLNPADRWPENDILSLPVPVAPRSQRWLVSTSRTLPADSWIRTPPDALPTDPSAYLAPAVIVLDNLAATDFSDAQLRLLEQYVRDLGGALVIAGGDRAFAPGLYAGTSLEALSPLASVPPEPAVHWALLADASGSMSQPAGAPGATRWQVAASAVIRLLPHLPPEDPVSVGGFAAELTWWSTGKTARETAGRPLPPPDVAPNGPTNLAAALRQVAREVDGKLPTELLVVSDADVTIDEPDALARDLRDKRVRLHLLAIGDGRGLDALRRITSATAGTLRRELDPAQWAAEVRQLLAAASPPRLVHTPTRLTFAGELSRLAARDAAPWNRTWLKPGATEVALGVTGNDTVPLGARWTAGADGVVLAFGFSPEPRELTATAALVARPPRDPRFAVTWDAGARLRVRIDALDRSPAGGGKYLNDLEFRVELSPQDEPARRPAHAVPQVAPGRYEVTLPASRVATFATLRLGARTIDRAAVAARYAPEFEAIGNDHAAMRRLADATGGRVVDAAWSKPLDLPSRGHDVSLAPWLALAAAIALGLALAHWRLR